MMEWKFRLLEENLLWMRATEKRLSLCSVRHCSAVCKWRNSHQATNAPRSSYILCAVWGRLNGSLKAAEEVSEAVQSPLQGEDCSRLGAYWESARNDLEAADTFLS